MVKNVFQSLTILHSIHSCIWQEMNHMFKEIPLKTLLCTFHFTKHLYNFRINKAELKNLKFYQLYY